MNEPDAWTEPIECREISPSLAELLETHGSQWLSLARSHCDDHHYGEDALSEALYALNRELLDGKVENPHAWMAATLRNRASERIRNECGQQRLRNDLSEAMPPPHAADHAGEDEPFLIGEEHWDAIRAALPSLPPRQREVIRLRLFDKLSSAETATRLGISEGATYTAQRYAISALRRLCGSGKTDASNE